ncbi:MAG TPA: hypothetical protein VNO14_09415 [Blastocatellia bacterium]|nr:hypothetical protein [Blastocatellia bacterium]
MRARVLVNISLFVLVLSFGGQAAPPSGQDSEIGPEVKAYLDFLSHEEAELEFQIRNNEIPRKNYVRAKNRIAILRKKVLELVKERGEDIVPELSVVTISEVDQLVEDGRRLVRDAQPGALFADKWRYLGRVSRGEIFYIFERITRK